MGNNDNQVVFHLNDKNYHDTKRAQKQMETDKGKVRELYEKYFDARKVTKELLRETVDVIYVTDDKRIEIRFRHSNRFLLSL